LRTVEKCTRHPERRQWKRRISLSLPTTYFRELVNAKHSRDSTIVSGPARDSLVVSILDVNLSNYFKSPDFSLGVDPMALSCSVLCLRRPGSGKVAQYHHLECLLSDRVHSFSLQCHDIHRIGSTMSWSLVSFRDCLFSLKLTFHSHSRHLIDLDGITFVTTTGPDPAGADIIPQMFFQFRGVF
jgi:hypothetical protein